MAKGVNVGETLAEEVEVDEQAPQQVRNHESDTSHREVV